MVKYKREVLGQLISHTHHQPLDANLDHKYPRGGCLGCFALACRCCLASQDIIELWEWRRRDESRREYDSAMRQPAASYHGRSRTFGSVGNRVSHSMVWCYLASGCIVTNTSVMIKCLSVIGTKHMKTT